MARTRTPKPVSAPPDGERLAIGALKHDPRQIRRHTEKNLAMIGDGLRAVGAARSIVLDEDNEILAGNGTIEAAAAGGLLASPRHRGGRDGDHRGPAARTDGETEGRARAL